MILVTGGTGGIGSELLRLLSEAGVRARGPLVHAKRPSSGPVGELTVGPIDFLGFLASEISELRAQLRHLVRVILRNQSVIGASDLFRRRAARQSKDNVRILDRFPGPSGCCAF